MSTVGGSGDDVVRKTRDEYRKKESDLIKKHQKEMQKVEEANEKQVNDLKTSQDKQYKALHKDTRETITAKDHKYQQEVENMRNIHRRQLQQAVEDSQQQQQSGNISKKMENGQQREQFESRLKGLQEQNVSNINKKTEEFQGTLEEMRNKQQDSVSENRNKMNLKHQQEMAALVEHREKDKANMQERYDAYRRTAEGKIENLNMKSWKDREKASENLLNTVRRERVTHEDTLTATKEGYKEALETTREKFDKVNNLRSGQQEEFRKNMENHVENRVMNKMHQLEVDKEDLKLGQALQRAELKRQSNKEVANIKNEFNKNIVGYEMDRKDALVESNESHARDINALSDKHSKVFTDAMRKQMAEKNSQQYRAQNALSDIQRDFGARTDQQKIMADMRVKNIHETSEESKARVIEQQKEVIEGMKFGHSEEIKEMRKKMEQDHRAVIDNLKDQMLKQEVANTEKNSMLMQKYEKQIAHLNDTLNKERREHDDYVRRAVSTLQQEHKQQLDTQNTQFTEKAKQMQERFQNELKTENRKYQEKTEQLISTIKKG